MKNLVFNSFPTVLLKSLKWTYSLSIVVLGLSFSACDDDPPACEMQNTGTFVVENSHANGSLQVHFNKSRVGANSVGDLSIQPGEKGSMELPAGNHKIVAILLISDCSGSRCSVQSSLRNDSREDLSACETRNYVF